MARGTGVAVVETAWRLLQSRAESFGHDGLCRGHAPTTGGCRDPVISRLLGILQDTVRASSAVECMNSVLRMQQSRHRRMTQPMLDLKRLPMNSPAWCALWGDRADAVSGSSLGRCRQSP